MEKYQSFLRWSLENQDFKSSTPVKPMDDDRRKWLIDAIESQMVNPADQLKNILHLIKDFQPTLNNDIAETKLLEIMQESQDFIEAIDLSLSFKDMKGIDIMLQVLLSADHTNNVKSKASEVISMVVHNHEENQTYMTENSIFQQIINLLTSSNNNILRSKLIMALAATIRGNKKTSDLFLNKFNGLKLLIEFNEQILNEGIFEKEEIRALRKSIFLLKYFVDDRDEIRKEIKEKYVKQIEAIYDHFSKEKEIDIDCREITKGILDLVKG
eukprot:snap_masked-scaffold_15-processed-gene-8.51-mRNA-1 protein AED:1.00 eAED:1.00 QI:0/-1/0/0/-1/1/1/0/269